MTTLPSDIPSFEGGANITPGVKSGNNKTLKELFEATRNDLIALETDVNAIPELTRYVDPNAPAGGDGSLLKPYNLIQDAIDDIETWAPNYFGFYIMGSIEIVGGPSVIIDENLIATQDNLFLYIVGNGASINPSSGEPFIMSNATKASIETWRTTHVYSDLQPKATPGKGPLICNLQGFGDITGGSGSHGACVLGVKGDATADTTELGWLYISSVNVNSGAGYSSIYLRNANGAYLMGGRYARPVTVLQTSQFFSDRSVQLRGGFYAEFDIADSEGYADAGFDYFQIKPGNFIFDKCTLGKGITKIQVDAAHFLGEVEFNDDAEISRFKGCHIGGNLDINGTGALPMEDVTVAGDADIVAAGNLDAKGCKFLGDFTAAAGAGVVDIHDSKITGVLTDPGDKVARDFVPAVTVWADANVGAGGDGTREKPYNDLQDAIDYLETHHASEFGTVMIMPGVYTGPFEVHRNISLIGVPGTVGCDVFITAPAGEVPITYTNATKASLATYRTTGAYSDLVNQGDAGPCDYTLANIAVYDAGWSHSIDFLGVAGDETATTTKFSSYNTAAPRAFGPTLCDLYLYGDMYCRNAVFINIIKSIVSGTTATCINCKTVTTSESQCGLEFDASFDSADPLGYAFSATKTQVIHTNSSYCKTKADDNVEIYGINSHFGEMDLNGMADIDIQGGFIRGDINAEAGVTAKLYGTSIRGDVTLANGAGAWSWVGGIIKGTTTDPGGRLTRQLVDGA
jgi:hypothetical protein